MRTGDLGAGVRDADEAREDVLGEHVGVALLRQVVRVHVDLVGGGGGRWGRIGLWLIGR